MVIAPPDYEEEEVEIPRLVESLAEDIEVLLGYSEEKKSTGEIYDFVRDDEVYDERFQDIVMDAISYLASEDRIEKKPDLRKDEGFVYVRTDQTII